MLVEGAESPKRLPTSPHGGGRSELHRMIDVLLFTGSASDGDE
jgi:hypothetical protein